MVTSYEIEDHDGDTEITFHHEPGGASWVVRMENELAAQLTSDLFLRLSIPGPAAT